MPRIQRHSVERFLHAIAVAALIGIAALAVDRGSVGNINPHVLSYYVINYDDGLIRRGLVGEVFSWFVRQDDLTAIKAGLLAMHTPLVATLLAGLTFWILILEHQRRDFVLLAVFAVFLTSQMVPTLAYDVGFLDVFIFLLITLAAAAFAQRLLWVVAIIGAIRPFVHDAFVFYWLALVAVGLWEDRNWSRVAVLLIPLVSSAIVYFGESLDVAATQMAASVLPDADKREALSLQFGQTFTSNVDMLLTKYRNYLGNALIAFGFYTFPAAIIVALYIAARRRSIEVAVLACAAIGPLLILDFAWDLSRFLVGSIFSALIAVLYMETVSPAARVSLRVPATGAIVAVLLAQVPFTYAYVEQAKVSDVGPSFFRSGPLGLLTEKATAFYSRAIGPKVSDRHGKDPLPPGDIWFVEEDIWRGAWVRRPGTNVFDAVMTLPVGSVETYTATIERDGDTIIARRNLDAKGSRDRMDYVGMLKGKAISGTYPGGYWFARIQN